MYRVKTYKEFINEGLYDPNILKAVFLAGGPGSGKSYVAHNLFGFDDIMKSTSVTGLKLVNSDIAFENFIKKAGYNPKDLATSEKIFKLMTKGKDSPREKAKELTKKFRDFYTIGKLGVIIDGTGKDFKKIQEGKNKLEALGYDCLMIFVNTSLETAKLRNETRDRILPSDLLIKSWENVQHNIGKFQTLFKRNFIIIDNNDIGDFTKLHNDKIKEVNKFLARDIENPIGKLWIKYETLAKSIQLKYNDK